MDAQHRAGAGVDGDERGGHLPRAQRAGVHLGGHGHLPPKYHPTRPGHDLDVQGSVVICVTLQRSEFCVYVSSQGPLSSKGVHSMSQQYLDRLRYHSKQHLLSVVSCLSSSIYSVSYHVLGINHSTSNRESIGINFQICYIPLYLLTK